MKTFLSNKLLSGLPVACVFLLSPFFFLPASVFAQAMSSANYQMQEQSVNFGGGNSTSTNFYMEDSLGEIATGYSSSTDVGVHGGYQQSQTGTSSAPAIQPSSGPVSSTPVSSVSIPGGTLLMPNPSDFQAAMNETQAGPNILLSWINPSDPRFVGVRIMRSEDFFPDGPTDGTLVYEGPLENFTDIDVLPGHTYYYAIFSEGANGLVSSGALTATSIINPSLSATTTPVVVSTNPFANLPQSPYGLNPLIQGLSLNDFQFIQNNQLLPIGPNGAVSLDGTENLTVRLPYADVPQILKTIALSLSDPQNPSKAFIFLLRANESQTYYEATIGPLGVSGTYPLAVTILDYDRRNMKQLGGSLVAVAAAQQAIGTVGTANLWWLFLILLLIILAIMYVRHRIKKSRHSQQSKVSAPKAPRSVPMPVPVAVSSSPVAASIPVVPAIEWKISEAAPVESAEPAKAVVVTQSVVPTESVSPVTSPLPVINFDSHKNSSPSKNNAVQAAGVAAAIILVILSAALFVKPAFAHAAFNPELNYQGKLLTSSGTATVPDGSYNLEFKLYTSSSGGGPIWTEDYLVSNSQGAAVRNGLFSVMLGSINSLSSVNFDQPLYLTINVGGTSLGPIWDGEMSPRKVLGTVPAAFIAETADTLGGLNSNQFLRSDAQNSTSTNSTFLSVVQTGAGKVAEFFGQASKSVFSILSNGNIGIGTTTPYTSLAVVGSSDLGNSATAGFFTATTTATSSLPYINTNDITAGTASTSNLVISGISGSTQCLQVNSAGIVSGAGAACGSGSGGSTSSASSTWATTTSSLAGEAVNYSDNNTDIITIGGNSTTTAKFFFDPNVMRAYMSGSLGIGTTSPWRALSVNGSSDLGINALAGYFTATSSTASQFPYASSTALSVSGEGYFGTASTTNLFVSNEGFFNTASTTNLFVSGSETAAAANISSLITNALTLGSLNGPLQANSGVVSATSSIGVAYGGTGLTSAPTYGQLLVGNNSGGYAFMGTSSLNLTIPLASTTGILGINQGGTGLNTTGASSTVLLSNGSSAFWQKLATSQLTNDSGFLTSAVTSINTTNGLTGGPITTTGTIGLDTSGIINNALLTYNGSKLVATGTQALTAGYFIATTSTASQLPYASSTALTSTGSAYFATLGGNVGIGTTTPGALLGVNGNILASNNITADGAISAFASTTPGYYYDGVGIITVQPASSTLDNYFFGELAGNLSETGSYNNGFGLDSLHSNTTGSDNTAMGNKSLLYNTSGQSNTAFGYESMQGSSTMNTTDEENSAFGLQSLENITSGNYNNAFGYKALQNVTTGTENLGIGWGTLDAATSTTEDAIVGTESFFIAEGGNYNSTLGWQDFHQELNGSWNSAVGRTAMWGCEQCNSDVAIGYDAGYPNNNFYANTASQADNQMTLVGTNSSRSGSVASTTGLTDGTAIGYNAEVGCSNCMVLGGTGADYENVGIGTTSPYAALSIDGSSDLGISALAGYFIATTSTASQLPYASSTALSVSGEGYFSIASTSNLIVSSLSGVSTRCLQIGPTGVVGAAASACGSGGGVTSGTWSTTTSSVAGELVNYSNNSTDIVTIGNNATTSSFAYFDPNAAQAYINGNLTSAAITVSGLASSTNAIISNTATTTNLAIAGIPSSLLKTNALGQVVAAVAGVDYDTFAYLFPNNATSTLLAFTNGIEALGSSTLQNFTFTNATGTSATTTNFFATTASSTNLSATNANVGSLTAATGNVASLTASAFTLGSLNGPLQANGGIVSATTSIGVAYGGTGLASGPAYGQVLLGNNSGGYTLTATSSLGLQSTITPGTGLSFTGNTLNSVWTQSGNNIFNNNTANIAIGTSSPYANLTIWGGSTGNVFQVANSASTTLLSIAAGGFGTTTLAGLNINGSATSTSNVGLNLSAGCYSINNSCIGTSTGTVSSIATNNGLTGGTITNSGTIGLDTSGIINNALLTYNGSKLVATGTQALTAGYFIATTSTASQLPYASSTALTSTGSAYFATLGGNVGIGTTTPGALLGVNGNILASNNITADGAISAFASTTPGYYYDGVGIITVQPASSTLDNYFFGELAGNLSETGSYNNGFGLDSLHSNTTGSDNTAMGNKSLLYNTSGQSNTAFGYESMQGSSTMNTTDEENSAFGLQSLENITSGNYNNAFGYKALQNLTTGTENLAIGWGTWDAATSTTEDASVGTESFYTAEGGNYNSTLGWQEFHQEVNGSWNSGVGRTAMWGCEQCNSDVAIGFDAGFGANTFYSNTASQSDNQMTFLGTLASRSGSVASTTGLTDGTAIGYNAEVGCSNCMVLGGTGADYENVGIGTTSPYAALSIDGSSDLGISALAGYFIATTSTASQLPYASSTALSVSGEGYFSIASTTNFLISGLGTLAGSVLAVNPQGQVIATTTAQGTVTSIATNNGLTGGTITNSGTIGLDTSGIINNALLTYNGSKLVATGTQALTAGYFIATTSTASQFPYASSTALSVSGEGYFGTASSTNLIASNFTLGNLNGPLQANGGVVSATTSIGVLYGGTGLASAPTYGQLLVGNVSGGYTLTSTSSLGIAGSNYWTLTGSSLYNNVGANVGIGTSSPYAALSVVGASGVVADNFTATDTAATSTFAGNVAINNGSFTYSYNTGITNIDSLQTGNLNLDTDAGVVSWTDLPVDSTPAAGTVEAYEAQIGDTPVLTVYGQANGSGGVQNLAVGIGTTSPYAALSVDGSSDLGISALAGYFIATTSTASQLPYASTTALTSTGSAYFATLGGNVGIGTSTPGALLGVNGNILASNNITANNAVNADATTTAGYYYDGVPIVLINGTNNGGLNNEFWGQNAGNASVTGTNNLAVGTNAGTNWTSDYSMSCVGYEACQGTSGDSSQEMTGLGYKACQNIDGAQEGVCIGPYADQDLTNGPYNIAIGYNDLKGETTGTEDLGIGWGDMGFATSTEDNIAVGNEALQYLTTGGYNTAIGWQAFNHLTSGINDAASGYQSFWSETTGSYNTGSGYRTGYGLNNESHDDQSVTDTDMTFLGAAATRDGSVVASTTAMNDAGAIGYDAKVGCSNCLVLGGVGANEVKVGIGTSTPYAALSVVGASGVVADHYVATDTAATSTMTQLSSTAFADSGLTAGDCVQAGANGFLTSASSACGSGGGGSGTVNSGTLGQLAFYGAGGTAVSGTSTIFLQQNDDVGISTTSTQIFDGLSVQTPNGATNAQSWYNSSGKQLGQMTNSGGFLAVNFQSTAATSPTSPAYRGSLSTTGIYFPTAASMGFSTGGVSGFIITNGSFIGSGTSTPWGQLSVAATTTSGIDAPTFVVAHSASGAGTTTDFDVLNNGNVGIGTTSPASVFSIGSGGTGIANFTTGTSTIYNNFDILGTGHAKTWYTGDLDFANNFAFTEAPLNGSPQALILKNQNHNPVMTIDENGNLDLIGDICANNNQCIGSSLVALQSALASSSASTASTTSLLGQGLATTTVSINDLSNELQTTNAALEALSGQFTAFAANGLASTTLNGMVVSTGAELASSTSFIQNIANTVVSVLEASGQTIQSAGTWIVGEIKAPLGIFDRVQTQTAAITQGLEMTDQNTGEVYCVSIRNGDWYKQIGSCGTIVPTVTVASSTTPTVTTPDNSTASSSTTGSLDTTPVSNDSTATSTASTATSTASTDTSNSPNNTATSTASTDSNSTASSTPSVGSTASTTPVVGSTGSTTSNSTASSTPATSTGSDTSNSSDLSSTASTTTSTNATSGSDLNTTTSTSSSEITSSSGSSTTNSSTSNTSDTSSSSSDSSSSSASSTVSDSGSSGSGGN